MIEASGSIKDDSKPLKIQKHAPIQSDDMDMRINVLKEYIKKVPNATLTDLKKALTGFSTSTENEFKELIKSANNEKYNEFYQKLQSPTYHKPMPKKIVYLPKVDIILNEAISCGSPYKKEELIFIQTHSNLPPRYVYTIYKIAFPQSQRNQKFIKDCKFLIKVNPKKYLVTDKQLVKQFPVKHIIPVEIPINNHILAQAINSLYKSGKLFRHVAY